MFDQINLEQYVTADHPMRKIRPLIDTVRIRQLCEPLYAETGRPSIPPEQRFLALLGGYLLGVTSERALVRELTGNLVLRWFVGLDLDQMPWDHSTFSQNRKRRFTESGLLKQPFDVFVLETGANDVEFRFAHRACESEQETVIEKGGVVNAIGVADERVGESA